LRNSRAEISKICIKYGATSFDELWDNLEKGKISEKEWFDDIPRLEFLEINAEKIQRLLDEYLTHDLP